MKINSLNLKQIIKAYTPSLIHKRISDITLVNSRLFLFTLKNEKQKLVVDLDNTKPHIGLLDTSYDELSLPSEFIARAMMNGRPLINDITQMNNDRVIRITTVATDAYYHQNRYYLYLELIPAHANMILTDQNNRIIVAFYETSPLNPRPLIKNGIYTLPAKKNEENTPIDFSLTTYSKYVEVAFNESLNKRKKELYGQYLKKYAKRVRALEKKISAIHDAKKKAEERLSDKERGELLLMNANEIKPGATSFQSIKLNPSKNAIQNANDYFAKYKKAKRTLINTEEILKSVEEELDTARFYCDVFTYASEEEIRTLLKPVNKSAKQNIPAYLPYYIDYQNVRYYFGENALENDYLTFKMFKNSSRATWLHLKDQPSAHLIINSENPSNQILDLAASILLVISRLNSGEIMYAHRRDLTRDNALAKVNVRHYQSINLRKINPLALELLKKKKRYHAEWRTNCSLN